MTVNFISLCIVSLLALIADLHTVVSTSFKTTMQIRNESPTLKYHISAVPILDSGDCGI